MIRDLLHKSFQINPEITFDKLLKQKLKETGLSKTQFERLSGLQRRSVDGIIYKTAKYTDVTTLLKLGEFLGLTLEQTIQLHFKDQPASGIKELQNAMDITFINKFFDLKTLASLGFIDKKASVENLSQRICEFFGIENIYEYDQELGEALYSRTKRSFDNKMKDFWIKASYRYFELIGNPNDYSREELKKLVPRIKPYTQNVREGLLTVFRALYNVGVTVVFQPMLPKTQIRGATFVIDGKPCIVITDLNKNYATVWFALIHELYHVLFDMELLDKTKYHLTGEPDLFLIQEDKANEFASEYLFSESRMRYIEPLINNHLMVSKFAKECEVHPSIIYSQYQFRQSERGRNYWGAFKEHFPDIELAKKNLYVSNWDIHSLEEASRNVKELLTV